MISCTMYMPNKSFDHNKINGNLPTQFQSFTNKAKPRKKQKDCQNPVKVYSRPFNINFI